MNEISPLVSIITLTYNHEKYIEKCISSVSNQTYHNFEHIIIDDGSTDCTVDIINSFYKSENRIKYIRQKNAGLEGIGRNYNKALSLSNGKYIAILEGDDYWHVHKLRMQVEMMEREESVLCYGRAYTINDSDELLDWFPKESVFRDEGISHNMPTGKFLRLYLFKSVIPSPTIMIRLDVLRSIGGFVQPRYMRVVDYPTVLHLSLQGRFSYIDQPIAFYRVHLQQATLGNEIPFDSAGKYAAEFFSSLPEAMKAQLRISESNLIKNIEVRKALNEFHKGRILLLEGKFKLARKYFVKLLRHNIPEMKIRAIMGLLMSLFHYDLEWLARLVGKRCLK
ncbi:MAG: glycosyltransferase [Thermodesulfobacteriota bacterium]|nr:glycosyltransferase [Thermodesulfobacteriota bacterium]